METTRDAGRVRPQWSTDQRLCLELTNVGRVPHATEAPLKLAQDDHEAKPCASSRRTLRIRSFGLVSTRVGRSLCSIVVTVGTSISTTCSCTSWSLRQRLTRRPG